LYDLEQYEFLTILLLTLFAMKWKLNGSEIKEETAICFELWSLQISRAWRSHAMSSFMVIASANLRGLTPN